MPGGSAFQELEERTFRFAQDCRHFIRQLPKSIGNENDAKQLIRASGSIAANYIEANEALGKKDRLMRLRICLKETKESNLWLRLVRTDNQETELKQKELEAESTEL